jgi:hypothetical protein
LGALQAGTRKRDDVSEVLNSTIKEIPFVETSIPAQAVFKVDVKAIAFKSLLSSPGRQRDPKTFM